jgi:hypothetical protein
MKPNCYNCKWRGNVPGDAHSCCKHPNNEESLNDPMMALMAIFASVQRVSPVRADTGLKVKGNPHGIKNGWFNWPFNFDPVWLDECDGFTNKEEK